MVNIKSKTILVSLIIVSLLFVTPYVESFSIGDLSDVVGYVLFNSFRVISGDAVYVEKAAVAVCDDPSDGCEDYGGGGGGGSYVGGICGDGTRQEGEGCDGDDFGLFPTCEARNYDGGILECTSSCDLILDGCYDFGDGDCNVDGGESCEDSPEDCGMCVGGGVDCSLVLCGDYSDVCGGKNTADCTGTQVCGVDFMGMPTCTVAEAPNLCGDNTREGAEVCDGTDLGVSSCITEGYDGGSLSCESDCLDFDYDRCYYDADDPGDGDDPGDTTPPEDKVPIEGVISCAAINGICTNECGANYDHYDGMNNLDNKCSSEYGQDLICCVPNYVLNAGYFSESGDYEGQDLTDQQEFTGTVKSVEDYSIQREQDAAKSAPSYALEGGLQQVLTSPSYAMGGVWIVFVLTAVIVGMTYYLDANVGSRLKFRRRKRK